MRTVQLETKRKWEDGQKLQSWLPYVYTTGGQVIATPNDADNLLPKHKAETYGSWQKARRVGGCPSNSQMTRLHQFRRWRCWRLRPRAKTSRSQSSTTNLRPPGPLSKPSWRQGPLEVLEPSPSYGSNSWQAVLGTSQCNATQSYPSARKAKNQIYQHLSWLNLWG